MKVIKKDCKFFEENAIIDYSLLIGIHYNNRSKTKSEEGFNFIFIFIFIFFLELYSLLFFKDSNCNIMNNNDSLNFNNVTHVNDR